MMRPTPEASWPDEDLVRECRAGNQAASDALIEKYKKLVYTMPARSSATGSRRHFPDGVGRSLQWDTDRSKLAEPN